MASRLPAPAPGLAGEDPSSQPQELVLRPGTLWAATVAASARATACGAVCPIAATYTVIEEAGVPFVIWSPAPRPRLPDAANREKPTYADDSPNPFLPYAPEMFVADLTPTHVCLLNKYNILAHHLLIVTRGFEHQEEWLTAADFTALWLCMAEFPGLGFYNAGKVAGASQRHKHLQYVSLPLAPTGPDLPIAALLDRAEYTGPIGHIAALPFRHALARLNPAWAATPTAAGAATLAIFVDLLQAVGIPYHAGRQTAPYNLLVTPAWMLLVPRSHESYRGISVNALGYAGSLLARDAPQREILQAEGPLGVLCQVGLPALA